MTVRDQPSLAPSPTIVVPNPLFEQRVTNTALAMCQAVEDDSGPETCRSARYIPCPAHDSAAREELLAAWRAEGCPTAESAGAYVLGAVGSE